MRADNQNIRCLSGVLEYARQFVLRVSARFAQLAAHAHVFRVGREHAIVCPIDDGKNVLSDENPTQPAGHRR